MTSWPMGRTILPRAISSPMPAISRSGLWSPPPSARSTARSRRCAPHERGPDGKPNPTYRCLFPEPPPPGTVPACAEAGILGALPGVLGSLMAFEVIREIVKFGEGLVGRLLMIDALAMRFETLSYAWDPANPLSGENPDNQGARSAIRNAPASRHLFPFPRGRARMTHPRSQLSNAP